MPTSSLRSLSLIVLALTLAGSAHARLGETKEQIQVRYGKPVKETSSDAQYEKQAWRIAVRYLDGKAVSETFTKAEAAEISHNEVEIILLKNANNDWVLLKNEKGRQRWQRPTGSLAEYTGKTLRLWTKRQDDLETINTNERERKKVETEKKDLEGF